MPFGQKRGGGRRKMVFSSYSVTKARPRSPPETCPPRRLDFLRVVLLTSVGVLVLGTAYSLSEDAALRVPLFWIGVLLVYAPGMTRLSFRSEMSETERLATLVMVTLTVYLIKVLHSPVMFTFSDEFSHWHNAIELVSTGRLFAPNPGLPVTPFYPALPLVTSSLVTTAQSSYFIAGLIVVGMARVILALSLYFIYEQVTDSPSIASGAVLIYFCNPSCVYFQAQYAYESLALPLVAFALYCLIKRQESPVALSWHLLLGLGIATVIVAHHLSTYGLILIMALWTLASWIANRSIPQFRRGALLTLATVGGTLIWQMFVAQGTLAYLDDATAGGLREARLLMSGQFEARPLFVTTVGTVAPLPERLLSFAAVGFTLLFLPFGWYAIWKRYRTQAFALTAFALSALYMLMIPMRFTIRGWEISNRSTALLFMGLALVIALGARQLMSIKRFRRAAALPVIVMFLGGMTSGWPYWARLPGPYMTIADTRSIEREGLETARWASRVLGEGQHIFTDRTNRQLMNSIGRQRIITHIYDDADGDFMFLETMEPDAIIEFMSTGIDFILVDQRLGGNLSLTGIYFEGGEPFSFNRVNPITPEALSKYNSVPEVNRLYDSGSLILYDIHRLSGRLLLPFASDTGKIPVDVTQPGTPLSGFLIPLLLLTVGASVSAFFFANYTLRPGRFLLVALAGYIIITVLFGLVTSALGLKVSSYTWIALAGILFVLGGINPRRELAALRLPSRLTYGAWARIAGATGGAITLVLLAFALVTARPQTANGAFTQLWLLPDFETSRTFQIGARNFESADKTYSLQVLVDGAVLLDIPHLDLRDEQEWETLVVPLNGDFTRIEARLRRLDSPDKIYRLVYWSAEGQS